MPFLNTYMKIFLLRADICGNYAKISNFEHHFLHHLFITTGNVKSKYLASRWAVLLILGLAIAS
jgi:hypothetical protein